MKKYIYLLGIIFYYSFSNSQTKITNCITNDSVINAIVINSQTSEWIGTTDDDGIIEISSNIKSITIIHPDYGETAIEINNDAVCLTSETEMLDEIVIDFNFKNELLEILDNSYKNFQTHNKGKKNYRIEYSLLSQNDGILESFKGIVSLGSIFTTTINNYELNWTVASIGNKSYKKLSSYEYFSYLSEYSLFNNKYRYRDLKDYIQNNEVVRIGNQYYVYRKNSDHFFVIDVNLDKKLISKYKNTEITANFHRQSNKEKFGTNDKKTANSLQVIFNIVDGYDIEEMTVNESYEIDNQNFYANSIINSLKLNKNEIKNLNGKGLIGFAKDYYKQQQEFL